MGSFVSKRVRNLVLNHFKLLFPNRPCEPTMVKGAYILVSACVARTEKDIRACEKVFILIRPSPSVFLSFCIHVGYCLHHKCKWRVCANFVFLSVFLSVCLSACLFVRLGRFVMKIYKKKFSIDFDVIWHNGVE